MNFPAATLIRSISGCAGNCVCEMSASVSEGVLCKSVLKGQAVL